MCSSFSSQGAVGLGYDPPTPPSPPLKLAVFGHSYVSKLRNIRREPIHSFNSPEGEREFAIRLFGVSGGRISSIRNTEAWTGLIDYRPRLIYVILGGNDLNASSNPEKVAEDLVLLAREIEGKTGGICKLFTIERRKKVREDDGFSVEKFNWQSGRVNKWLDRHHPRLIVNIKFKIQDLDADHVHPAESARFALWEKIVGLFTRNLERESCYINLRIPERFGWPSCLE